MSTEDQPTAPTVELSAALDEIYRLRRALAYEASAAEVHGSYKTFPKSRRGELVASIDRMRLAARGQSDVAYADRSGKSLHWAMREADAPDSLTRWSFLAEPAQTWVRKRLGLTDGDDQ